ncbi:MAG: hypothetical protein K2X64_01515, partial [Rhodocyclaceae bacterium]|nr:hypothetical protein [Rhodocyclaceae bacterium]
EDTLELQPCCEELAIPLPESRDENSEPAQANTYREAEGEITGFRSGASPSGPDLVVVPSQDGAEHHQDKSHDELYAAS